MARLEVETDEFHYMPTRQGGVEPTVLWNVFLRRLLLDLDDRFQGLNGGVDVGGLGRVSCLAWADNLYLVAHTMEIARNMLDTVMQELSRHGMELKADEVFLLRSDVSTCPGSHLQELLTPADGRLSIAEVEDLNILGMVLSRDPAQAVRARLHRAQGAFWALADYWKCSSIAMEEKCDVFVRRVRPCALYGAAMWTWTRETTGMLSRWENRMLCKMLGSRMRPGEMWPELQSQHCQASVSCYGTQILAH